MAIFNWEWGRNSAPRKGQKMPWIVTADQVVQLVGSQNDNLIYQLKLILIALLHDVLLIVAYLTPCVFIRSL